MDRKDTLDRAAAAVLSDRQSTYGTPEDNFGMVANYWSTHLGREVTATDVAIMLSLLKIARLKTSPMHADNWVDLAGYAACGAEVAKARLPGDDKVAEMGAYKEGVEVHMTPKMEHARHRRGEIIRRFAVTNEVRPYDPNAPIPKPNPDEGVMFVVTSEFPGHPVVLTRAELDEYLRPTPAPSKRK